MSESKGKKRDALDDRLYQPGVSGRIDRDVLDRADPGRFHFLPISMKNPTVRLVGASIRLGCRPCRRCRMLGSFEK
jgi:hypothetical protein